MAREEIFFGINIDTGEVIKDFGTLKKRTKELKKELDGTKVGTKRFNELKKEITSNQATIRRFNRELRQTKSLATRVGQGMTNAFKQVGVALAGAFAVTRLFDVFKNGLNVIIDFEQAIADVGAVSGATADQLAMLEESARELGKSSIFTAQEVAGLQLELAKLGFTTEEIISASGGILDLSTAFRIDLSQAAEVTASTLRAFGLDAEDTTYLTDLMADSFSSTALDINRFQESIKLVAPAAKQTGRDVKEVTALLGVLANNGISGSIAGTQLNRVFIELNKKGLTLQQAMNQVAQSTDKLGTSTELVGDRGAKALAIFADQSEALRILRQDFDDVDGSAKTLAERSGDTLQGALLRLKSAYDELILKFSESKGPIRDIVKQITDFINSIDEQDVEEFIAAVKNLGRTIQIGVRAWLAYKSAVLATNLATTAFSVAQKAAAFATALFSKGIKGVTTSFKGLNLAIKANPIGLIASAITTVISLIPIWTDKTEDQTKAQKDLNDELSKTDKFLADPESVFGALLSGADASKFSIEDLERALNFARVELSKIKEETIAFGVAEAQNFTNQEEFEAARRKRYLEQKAQIQDIINQLELQIDKQNEAVNPSDIGGTTGRSPIQIADNPAEDPRVAFEREVTELLKDEELKRVENVKQANKKKEIDNTNYAVSQQETNQMILDSTANLIGSTINLLARDEEARQKNGRLIKALAIAEIGVNLQKQLSNILTVNGSPTNVANLFSFGAAGAAATAIQSALAVASAGVQIATVSSQKFAKGGILSGPSHAQGGIKTPFGELEGGEAVINKKSTRKHAGLLSAINEDGGGKKFARGGVLGVPNVVTTPDASNAQLLKALNNFDMRPTVSVVEINEAQTRISEIENNSTL